MGCRGRIANAAASPVGVVYRDADDGQVVLELDGRLFHDSTEQRDLDFERDLDLAVEGGPAHGSRGARSTAAVLDGGKVGRCSAARVAGQPPGRPECGLVSRPPVAQESPAGRYVPAR